VRVGLDGAMFTLGVDTGAQYSALREDVVATRPLPLTPAAGDRPPFYPARHAVVGGNDLGTLEFVVLPLQLPRGIDGVLGYNFFTGHVVCLDYERGELRVR